MLNSLKMKKKFNIIMMFILFIFVLLIGTKSFAAPNDVIIPKIDMTLGAANEPVEVTNSLKVLFFLTIIALAPSILIMMTSFTRVIVILHFIRSALGTQQSPPNQVLIGLALFITLFIMSPVIAQINEQAIKPYNQGSISQKVAIEKGMKPLKEFMINQTYEKDLQLFIGMSNIETVENVEELPATVIIPSFIISELKKGFMIGFIIYIPFLAIDMIVASTLMAMGMMMLPPTSIAIPFKILLFVMVDGWNLIIGQVVKSFRWGG